MDLESAVRIEGLIVPVVTPMDEVGEVDLDAFEPLLRWFAASGVRSVMLAGTSGEGHALTEQDLGAIATVVVPLWRSLVGEQAQVLLSVSAGSTREQRRRAEEVLRRGPDAVVATPPYYFRYTDDEIVRHYEALGTIGAPVVAYDTPRYTGNPLSPAVLDALADMPHVVGIKMSAGDMDLVRYACKLDATSRSFAVAQGDEGELVSAIRLGASAIIPGVANVLPGLSVRLDAAARAGDWDTADQAQSGLRRMGAIHGIRRGVVSTKTAMQLLGHGQPFCSEPFRPYDRLELASLRALLGELDDLTGAELS